MRHTIISYIKSAVRLTGYFMGMWAVPEFSLLWRAFAILVISEVIGIIEEIGE